LHSLRLNPAHWSFIAALLRREVRFVVVGGFAVSAYIPSRRPKDMDVLVEPADANRRKLDTALRDVGHRMQASARRGFTRPKGRAHLVFDGSHFDILTSVDDVTFDEAAATAVAVPSGGLFVPVLGKAQLIRSKRSRPEPKDRQDVDALLERE